MLTLLAHISSQSTASTSEIIKLNTSQYWPL